MSTGRTECWRWALWSWRNVAVTTVVTVVVFAGAGRVLSLGEPTSPRGSDYPSASAASADDPSPTTSPPLSAASVPPAAPVRPEEVSLSFVRVWARPDAVDPVWRTECAAYATDGFAKVLSTATSGSVAASRVVGDAEILERTESEATVRVTTDGGAVLVRLLHERETWRVDDIEPEQAPALAQASRG